MLDKKIIINREILEKIYALAREGFPYEICGWLGGNPVDGLVTDIRPAKNVYNQTCRYEPQVLVMVLGCA